LFYGSPHTASGFANLRIWAEAEVDPAELLSDLIASVQLGVSNGDLKASHGRALTNKLESALDNLEKDDTAAVVDKQQGFIDQVTNLEADGQISTEKATTLIADAQAILDAVEGSGG
jgi:hypothetical protein